MKKYMTIPIKTIALAIVALGSYVVAIAPANATLIADGVTYDLSMTAFDTSTLTGDFKLDISGINGPTDTEGGGRIGVEAIAFTQPTNYDSSSPMSPLLPGGDGLDAGGCQSSSSNWFCFTNGTDMTGWSALAADSMLSYEFKVTLSSGDFTDYFPSFKINWYGTKSKNYNFSDMSAFKSGYDLVSKPINVPEPGPLALMGAALIGFVAVRLPRRLRA